MGQYHYLVNLSKKQFVNPHEIGNGLKLREQVGWQCSTSTALVMLLAASNGRGGGDFNNGNPTSSRLIGSWAGDRVAFIGDYAEEDDIRGVNAVQIYEDISRDGWPNDGWVNISPHVREMMAEEFNVRYTGNLGEWLEIQPKTKPEPKPVPAPKKHPIEDNPMFRFYYPNSKNYGKPTYREVRVISANDRYVWGLDTTDKNRIKKFCRDRITHWACGESIMFYNAGSMPK
jgi:hypothetical protein